jgi:hypothetical protein
MLALPSFKRGKIMNRDGHNDIMYFVGPEVEHTPAYSKKTLFVVGKQPVDEIVDLARQHKAPHIFMGANHSFESTVDAYWDMTITALLDRGFWVTLDYQAHLHEKVLGMLNKGIWQSRMFVPLLSVRIPSVQTSSPNLTVKIDDIDFKGTNPGVWCMHFHEVTDSNRFTDWVEYGSDVVITLDDKPTPMPPYAPQPQVSTEMREMRKTVDLSTLHPIEVKALQDPDVLAGFNDATLGLDLESKSSLKPDPEEVIAKVTPASAAAAAEIYADGTTSDPLSKEGSKKGTKKK